MAGVRRELGSVSSSSSCGGDGCVHALAGKLRDDDPSPQSAQRLFRRSSISNHSAGAMAEKEVEAVQGSSLAVLTSVQVTNPRTQRSVREHARVTH